ncbi:MAG: hypothetical protein PF590_04155, partial [Candidatus Delongbacteria bacterium]|nr:hypothetical protein [Candidatus Delongbacteria bacterium]
MFITKITNAGSHSWTRQYTATGGVTADGISASGNNVYVGGKFEGTANFGSYDQSDGTWGSAVYILQLDRSNGDVTMSDKAGGSSVSTYNPKLYNVSNGDLIVGGLVYSISLPMNFGSNAITLERSSGYVAKRSFCEPSVAPTSAIASPTSVCESTPTNLTLTASGGTLGTGAVVEWYTGGCSTTLVGTGNPLVVSQTLSSPTTYYAMYNGDCGTTNCVTTVVSVNTNVGITSATAAASPICSSSTTDINANGVAGTGATLTWYTGTGGTGTNLGSSNPLTVGPGTYYARVTGTCGAPVEASVTVSSYTDVSITSATAAASPICSSSTTDITASGVAGTGATLTWYTGTGGTGTNLGS